MSWESYSFMKCKKCGNIYKIENSTLVMNRKGYDRCPLCHSEGEEISSKSMLDVINEQSEKLKKRKKRIILWKRCLKKRLFNI